MRPVSKYQNGKSKSGFHGLIKWIVILLIVFAAAFFIYVNVKINEPLRTDNGQTLFTVPIGASVKQIAASLEEADIISSAFFFELHTFFKGSTERVQAGDYELSSTMSVRDILTAFTTGQTIFDAVSVTIIEGWDAEEIGQALEAAGVISASEFIEAVGFRGSDESLDFVGEFDFLAEKTGSSLEGFLFPDTYFFEKESEAGDVVRKILNNFAAKVDEELRGQVAGQGKGLYEVLILASIVEREVGRNVKSGTKLQEAEIARVQEERRTVAGVFLNRLEIGMALESDATIGYISGSRSNRATFAELEINSPYNTYQHQGLPPSPIASPSLDSIAAVVNPIDSDYLFFLTSPDGTAHFAENLTGHNRNRELFLQ